MDIVADRDRSIDDEQKKEIYPIQDSEPIETLLNDTRLPLFRHKHTYDTLQSMLVVHGFPCLSTASFVHHPYPVQQDFWVAHDPDHLVYWVNPEGGSSHSLIFLSSRLCDHDTSSRHEYFMKTSYSTFLSLLTTTPLTQGSLG